MGVPFALNTFLDKKIFGSKYVSGSWEPESDVYDASGITVNAPAFSAGAIKNNLTTTKGIVAATRPTGGSIVFLGNGSPDTPVTIDTSAYAQYQLLAGNGKIPGGAVAWERTSGAFFRGSKYFLFMLVADTPTRVGVLMGDGSSSTWPEQDAANAPVISDPGMSFTGSFQGLYWDGTSSLVHVLVNTASNTYAPPAAIYTFDLDTQTWALLSGSQTNVPFQDVFAGSIAGFIQVWNDGSIGCLYNYGGGYGNALYYNKFTPGSPGSWGTEVLVRSGPMQMGTVIPDPINNLMRVFIYSPFDSMSWPQNPAVYFTVAPDGSSSADLFTFTAPVGQTDGIGWGAIDGDTIFLPFDDQDDASNAVWTGSISAPGSWTKVLLPLPVGELDAPSCAMIFFTTGDNVTVDVDPGALALTSFAPVVSVGGGGGGGGGGSPGQVGQGCSVWELRRVYVTMRPDPRVPVRGS